MSRIRTGDSNIGWTRRDLLFLGMTGWAGMAGACRIRRSEEGLAMARGRDRGTTERSEAAVEGRLLARPGRPTEAAKPGLHPLGLARGRDGFLYVPDGYRADRPAPLVVMLHGAGGEARHALGPFRPFADEAGLLLLAPDSRRQTWDVIYGHYGPDVDFIDRALAWTFARCAVDPAHVAAEGFSDGASYALSLGIGNGDLFSHVIAFSPGFMAPGGQEGEPRIFVSHGTGDRVLPIDACSRRLVPRLRSAGYEVLYREFEGPHTVPDKVAREALDWFVQDGITSPR